MELLVPSDTDGKMEPAAVANFTFVARDPVTNKATKINKLRPDTEAQKHLFSMIADKVEATKKRLKSPPDVRLKGKIT